MRPFASTSARAFCRRLRGARTTAADASWPLAHVERLAFVWQCRSRDMALDEIRALIELRAAPRRTVAGSAPCSMGTSSV